MDAYHSCKAQDGKPSFYFILHYAIASCMIGLDLCGLYCFIPSLTPSLNLTLGVDRAITWLTMAKTFDRKY